MSWLAIVIFIIVIVLIAEACLIIPDKFPWNRRKRK